tara:strand:- start:1073 stop:2359 length:1287 start_codon:yes stop_codon:yes gene_type:complete
MLLQQIAKENFPPNFMHATEFNINNPKVYYSGPYWDSHEIAVAMYAFLSGKWLSTGENVHKFEVAFSKKFNHKKSLMVNSGSSANLVMLAALKKVFKWDDNDEIIVSTVGFPTTIAPIIQNNLKPIFVDIEMDTLNIDIKLIKEKLTSKTKAIFISPVLGNPPDMDDISFLAIANNIKIILDNCDSLGSKWFDKYLTDYAIASSCSFYPSHHITTGEGGMVSSNIPEIIDTARSFAWWGRDCYCVGSANLLPCGTCGTRFNKWIDNVDINIDHKYVFTNIGYNLKPLDLQGAIGLVQLRKFDEIHKKRLAHKNIIQDIFEHNLNNLIHIPIELCGATTSWFGVPVICKNYNIKQKLVTYLENNNIQTRNYFAGNILLHPGYKHLGNYNAYPNANKVLEKVFFIGCAPQYTKEVFEYISNTLSKFKYEE